MQIPKELRAARSASLLAPLFMLAAIPVASAQVRPPAQAPPVQKTLGPGEVHVGKSRIYVHVFKTGLGHEHAVVGSVKEGVLHLGAPQDAGQVTVDLGSFLADPDTARKFIGLAGTTDAGTQQKVTANMLGSDVLNVTKFPTTSAKFHAARLLAKPSQRGLPQYALDADLTLHGVTRKLQVVAEAEDSDGWVRLRAHWPLVQSEFGMTPYTAALGAIGVADQLELYCDLYLAKENRVSQAAGGAVR